jgi:hypothetical protein
MQHVSVPVFESWGSRISKFYNGIVNPLPDPVRTDLYNIVFKFQKGQIDSKSVSETSVLVMTSLSEHLENLDIRLPQLSNTGTDTCCSIRVFLSTVLSQTVSQDI